MTELIIAYSGAPGPQGPAGSDGQDAAPLTVQKGDTVAQDVARIIVGDNLALTDNGDGSVQIDGQAGGGGGGSGAAGVWGADYGLTFDGTTDGTNILNDVLANAPPGSVIRPYSASGQPLRFNGRVRVPSYVTLDLSQIDVDLGKYGEVTIHGGFTELPESELFRLRVQAAPGDDVIQVDITPQANDMSLLAVGSWIILRGKNDGAGNAIQRHEARITARSTTLGAETITIDPPIPEDEGTFLVTYPAGDYESTFGRVDRSYITVKVGQALEADVEAGQDFVQVPTPASFPAGSIVELFDDYKAGDIGGTSKNSIRDEILRGRSVDGDLVYFHKRIERDYLVSRTATLFAITPVVEAHIIGARRTRLVEAPDAAPNPRRHYYMIAYGERCTIRKGLVNELGASHAHRGQPARMYRSIDCKLIDCGRIAPENAVSLATSGDLYGPADYYGSDNEIIGSYTERCRHGPMAHGSTRTTIRDFRSVNDLVNGCDSHGLHEVGLTIRDGRIEIGRDFAADATTQSGITLGNTSHYGGSHRVTIRDVEIVAPPGVAETRGLTIRAGCSAIELTKGVRATGVEIGCDVQRNSNMPSLETTDVDLGGLIAEDTLAEGIRLSGHAPAWEASTSYTGSASRPAFVESDGKVYKTTAGGTSGVTPPTHGSGSVSDGGVTWTFVTATPYVPLQRIKLDSAKLRGCAQQVRARRVLDLQAYDVRITEPAQPIVESSGLLNPGFAVTEVTDLVVRNSDVFGTAGGIVATDCPGALISENAFYDMEYGEAWYIDLGGNDGTELNDNKPRGATLGVDNSGGSSLSITGGGGGGSGDIQTAENVGTGAGLWRDKNVDTLRFRSLKSGTVALAFAQNADDVTATIADGTTSDPGLLPTADKTKLDALATSRQLPAGGTTGQALTKVDGTNYNVAWATVSGGGGGGGDIDDAANLGAGAGVWQDKVGATLRFRSLSTSTAALGITQNVDEVSFGIAVATGSQAGLMAAADLTRLYNLTAAMIAETSTLKIMTSAERTKLAAIDETRQIPAGGVAGQVVGKDAGGALAWLTAAAFPIRVDQAQGILVIGPSNYAADLGSGLTNATATFYSYGAGTPRVALNLVAAAVDGDFLRCINFGRKRSFILHTNANDETEFDLFAKDGTNLRLRMSAGGMLLGNNMQSETLAADETLLVKGKARFTDPITAPTAGNIFSNPIVIGAVRLWDDGTKLRAKRGAAPTSATDGSVLW